LIWYNKIMNNDGKKQSLRDVTVTLTGLELVRCLRAFVDARCDALDLQGHDDWQSVVDARFVTERGSGPSRAHQPKAGDISAQAERDAVFFAKLEELHLRGDLRSLVAAKEFAHSVCAGDPLFTRQGDEVSSFGPLDNT